MSSVKSFRLDNSYIQKINFIEKECGVDFKHLLENFIDQNYFACNEKINESRQMCFICEDFSNEIFSDFYLLECLAWKELKNNRSFGLDSDVVPCYGPSVEILED